jgi:hypothetical protein
MTSSRKRTAYRTPCRSLSQSTSPSFTNLARLSAPKLQTPQAGSPCSPHGLVHRIGAKYQELLNLLYRSTKKTPGSALAQALSMMLSHISRAFVVLWTTTGLPAACQAARSPFQVSS